MKFNIYVPSYKRSDAIHTHHLLEYCTYVVRKSEEESYKTAGVNVLAVEDNLIDSLPKVQNWIIENTPEDVVGIADDDILQFIYRIESNDRIDDPSAACSEIERMAQIICDLGIGYFSITNDRSPMYYSSEFKFCGMTGPLRIVNKKKCKSRFNEIDFFNDSDFQLQELLTNRIILIPSYFCCEAKIDTNSGGSNDTKTKVKYDIANIEMANRWGRYWKIPGRISVKR